MAIKTLRVFAEYTSTGFVPMPTAGGIDYGYTLASTFPSATPSSFQTDDPDIDVTVTAMTDFYVWIRINGTAWNPSYTRNVRVYPDSPDINSVVMNMIIATGPAGTSAYSQIVQTSNRLYFNGATADSTYNSKFAGKTYINELNFGTAPGLATVATTGAYADLTGKPALSTVATSGSYADLSNKPSGTAPISYNSGTNSFQISVASASTNGYLTSTDWSTFNAKYLLPSGGTTAQYLRGDGTLATFPTTLDSTRLIFTGKNTTGATLTKGTVVYINGVSGNTALLAKAIASGDSTSAQTLGVVEFDIANNQSGVVVLVGSVANLDTSSFTEGVQLYLSGTTAGAYTSTKILAPTHLVYVGIVTRAHPTQGTIEVKIQNGYELDELHDVQISSPANKDILYRDSATSLWKHASIASVLGYTPYNATNPNNYIALTALSASAPLSYNNTTGAFTISQANTTTNGFLSSTDWNTFNSKQNALTIGNFTEVNSNVFMFPDGTTGKTIGNLSIQMIQAGASTNGYLSSTDWSTFNNKQGAITLTTTGTSGAATFSSNTLNIPQYSTDISGLVTLTTTQTISGAKTFSSALNGTSATFSGNANAASFFAGSGINQASLEAGYLRFYHAASAAKFIKLSDDSTTIDAIGFLKNGTVATTWFPNGNVGVQTSTPGLNLSVQGLPGMPATSGAQGTGILRVQDSSSNISLDMGIIQYFGSWIQSVNKSNSSALTLALNPNGGNVGIGTSSPNAKLTIVAPSSSTAISLWGRSTDNYSAIRFQSNTGAITYSTIYSDASNLIFENNGGVERMRITSAGNVGIGTSSPNEKLHVSGNISIVGSSGTRIGFNTTDQFSALGTSIPQYGIGYGWSSQPLSLSGYYGIAFFTTSEERMRITSAGRVGMGLSNPFTQLHVGGSTTSEISIGSASYGGSTGNPLVAISCVQNGEDSNIGGHLVFKSSGWYNTNYGPIERMRLSTQGNLLIGTTSDPGYRLYVSGQIYATSNITANSDLTLKKNLKLVENPIDKLNQLNGYLYQWKENDEYQYGVIAQEVEKILPHAVSTGKDGIKGVAYNQIIPVLIEAVKELNAEVKLLKAK